LKLLPELSRDDQSAMLSALPAEGHVNLDDVSVLADNGSEIQRAAIPGRI
jgi:hypothetical protein